MVFSSFNFAHVLLVLPRVIFPSLFFAPFFLALTWRDIFARFIAPLTLTWRDIFARFIEHQSPFLSGNSRTKTKKNRASAGFAQALDTRSSAVHRYVPAAEGDKSRRQRASGVQNKHGTKQTHTLVEPNRLYSIHPAYFPEKRSAPLPSDVGTKKVHETIEGGRRPPSPRPSHSTPVAMYGTLPPRTLTLIPRAVLCTGPLPPLPFRHPLVCMGPPPPDPTSTAIYETPQSHPAFHLLHWLSYLSMYRLPWRVEPGGASRAQRR